MRPPKPSPVTPDALCRRHVEALARSGQTVPAYAREHGLKPDTLYRWRRRFPPSAQEPAAATPRLVPITVEVGNRCTSPRSSAASSPDAPLRARAPGARGRRRDRGASS